MSNFDAEEIEQLLLHATEPHAQLAYDGWLLRFAPDDAKRANSTQAPAAGQRPLDLKIDRVEGNYQGRGFTPLFRLTPMSRPLELDANLEARGYRHFDDSLVQATTISPDLEGKAPDGLTFEWPALEAWNEACSILHDRTADEAYARLMRLKVNKLPKAGLLAWQERTLAGCGLLMTEGDWGGLFEIVVVDSLRGKGIGTAISAALMAKAREQGCTHAWLSVLSDNKAALAIYEKLGFETVYDYWYREKA